MVPGTRFEIPLRRIFWVLMACTLALVVLDAVPVLLRRLAGIELPPSIESRVQLNGEANIPTWFSTVLLFSVAATSLANHWLGAEPAGRNVVRRLFWLAFGIVFVYVSLDEAARFHELIDSESQYRLKWVFFYAPFAGIFLAACTYYLLWLRKDSPELTRWILGGLATYLAGGLLAEFVAYSLAMAGQLTSEALHVEMTLEETLEMSGTILLWMGCLHEFQSRLNRFLARRAFALPMPGGKPQMD